MGAGDIREYFSERCRQLLGSAASSKMAVIDDAEGLAAEESLAEEIERLTGLDSLRCQACGKGHLMIVEKLLSREERLHRAARGRREVLADDRLAARA